MAKKGKPTKSFMSHLKHREGSVDKSYLDSVGKLTGGIGHLLLEEEKKLYPKGTKIPETVRSEWIAKDSVKAWDAAIEQADSLGVSESDQFIEALGSVNFQMGTNWKNKFPSAWKALKSGDFTEAIDQLEYVNPRNKKLGESKWKNQTPKRVKDFVNAIKELKAIKDNIAFSAENTIKKNASNKAFESMESVNKEDNSNIQNFENEMKAARARGLKRQR
jgi:GH24 family phage-related lysozyme (muramidase)